MNIWKYDSMPLISSYPKRKSNNISKASYVFTTKCSYVFLKKQTPTFPSFPLSHPVSSASVGMSFSQQALSQNPISVTCSSSKKPDHLCFMKWRCKNEYQQHIDETTNQSVTTSFAVSHKRQGWQESKIFQGKTSGREEASNNSVVSEKNKKGIIKVWFCQTLR